MSPDQIAAYLSAVDAYLKALHDDLDHRLSTFWVDPPPPSLKDFK